jgi:hypothetical protein
LRLCDKAVRESEYGALGEYVVHVRILRSPTREVWRGTIPWGTVNGAKSICKYVAKHESTTFMRYTGVRPRFPVLQRDDLVIIESITRA